VPEEKDPEQQKSANSEMQALLSGSDWNLLCLDANDTMKP
jgi:hypothetical protein